MMTEDIKQLSIENLFGGDVQYIIPIYQRNYAWEEAEISQLILDISDFVSTDPQKKYYLGTLVVYNRGTIFEVIDGQQRLTTLFLLLIYLKNELKNKEEFSLKNILSFDYREHSNKSLEHLFNGNDLTKVLNENEIEKSILNGYEIIEKNIKNIYKENKKTQEKFLEYLLENIKIARVCVPKDTDLNH